MFFLFRGPQRRGAGSPAPPACRGASRPHGPGKRGGCRLRPAPRLGGQGDPGTAGTPGSGGRPSQGGASPAERQWAAEEPGPQPPPAFGQPRPLSHPPRPRPRLAPAGRQPPGPRQPPGLRQPAPRGQACPAARLPAMGNCTKTPERRLPKVRPGPPRGGPGSGPPLRPAADARSAPQDGKPRSGPPTPGAGDPEEAAEVAQSPPLQSYSVLQGLVGPACIFLRQSIAITQLDRELRPEEIEGPRRLHQLQGPGRVHADHGLHAHRDGAHRAVPADHRGQGGFRRLRGADGPQDAGGDGGHDRDQGAARRLPRVRQQRGRADQHGGAAGGHVQAAGAAAQLPGGGRDPQGRGSQRGRPGGLRRVCADDVALRAARANMGPEPPPCLTKRRGPRRRSPAPAAAAGAVPAQHGARARDEALASSAPEVLRLALGHAPARPLRSKRGVGCRGRRWAPFRRRLGRALAALALISALSCSPPLSVPLPTPPAVPQNSNVPLPCPPSCTPALPAHASSLRFDPRYPTPSPSP
ncbi:uncharacterized protein J5F26_005803 isoform 1-T1 [Ciconia maguari]